jgi:hypothetical protein
MFLRRGKNKGDEGSLFQFLLAIAAVATTAMFFSPFSEITCQFGFMFMGAAVAMAAAALFTLIEIRRRRRASLGRELTQDAVWASGNAVRSVESTFSVIKAEQNGTAEPSAESGGTCFHHENPCENQGQLTPNLAASTLFLENLDSESPDPR